MTEIQLNAIGRLKTWRPDPWTLVFGGLVIAVPGVVQLWRVRGELTTLTVESATIFYGLSAVITAGLFLAVWGVLILVLSSVHRRVREVI